MECCGCWHLWAAVVYQHTVNTCPNTAQPQVCYCFNATFTTFTAASNIKAEAVFIFIVIFSPSWELTHGRIVFCIMDEIVFLKTVFIKGRLRGLKSGQRNCPLDRRQNEITDVLGVFCKN